MRSKRTQKSSSIVTGKAAPNGREARDSTTSVLGAEDARREAEQKYRDIFENAVEGIFQTRPGGGFITANPALARMLGFESPEELIRGRAHTSGGTYYVHPERRVELKRLLDQHDTVRGFEFEAYRKDGTKIWMSDNVRAVRDASGNLLYYEGTVEDITERKRAEESLRKQNEYLAALHETALGLINRLDLDELLEDILTRALALVDMPGGYVYLVGPGATEMRVTVGVGASRDFVGARISKGQGLAGRIWQTGQPLVVEDYRNWEHRLRDAGYDVLRTVGAVPLKSGSRVVGVLGVESSADGQGLSGHQMDILNRFAQLASIALDNAQLHSAVQQELAERKRAEEDISNLRRELELTMNSMEEGIHRVDMHGNIDFENPAAARMLGWEVAELLGKPAHVTMHHTKPDGTPYPKEECPIYATIGDGVPRHGADEVFWRKDGTSFPVEYTTAPMRNDRNEIVAIVVTFQDITERRRAEAALRESEERFSRAFHSNPAPLIITRLDDGCFLNVNDAFLLAFEYERAEVIGETVLSLNVYVDPEDRKTLVDQLQEQGALRGYESRARTKSGRILDLWVSVEPVTLKGQQCILSTAYDVTERKRVEEELRKSEERYRELFENDKDAIYVHDLNGVYTSVNRAAERLSGCAREEILGKHFWDFVAPEYTKQVRENFRKKLDETVETNYELEIINRRGARVPVEVSSRLIYENGVAVGVQGSARDITERKRAQQALLTYSRRLLDEQEAERGRIARELHDQIGQMLTALKLNLHAIRSARGEVEASLLIEDNLKMIDGALEQVRDLSVDLRPLLLDDLGLVTALHWFVDQQAQRTGVRAEFISDSLDSDLRFSAELEIACFRIAQEALTNVVRHARAQTVTVRLFRNRDYLILLIEDDGVGFDMEAMQEHALASATLGLRGMEERAHAVGGRVKIDSALDKGTKVFVELPIAMPKSRKPELQ